ncbi:hypothetical protein KUCAC02_037078, partial [Chaenocephalus aceratus]
RCKYLCCVEEQEGRPLFKVRVEEQGYDDIILTGPSPKVYLKGEDLFGLTTSAVTRIIESYTFRYGRNPLMEWPLAFNPTGSARSEPKAIQTKRPTLLTSAAPRCQGSVGSIVGLVPGVLSLSPGELLVGGAHQGRHSKASQYRRMTSEWKTNGLGLYAARDMEKCTMMIEYIGTIIRSEVANRKERLYEAQNRGVYMFRIDNDFVIDATITGGPARRYELWENKNVYYYPVSQLSYDYKFDLEDDQHKIPCHCGTVNCRKWMN